MYTHVQSGTLWVCMYTYNAYTWKQEDSLGCHSSGAIQLVFWDRLSHWPRACWCCRAVWPPRSSKLPGSTSPVLGSEAWTVALAFCVVLEREWRSSCWHNKHYQPSISPGTLHIYFLWIYGVGGQTRVLYKLGTTCFLVLEGYILISLCGLTDLKFMIFP